MMVDTGSLNKRLSFQTSTLSVLLPLLAGRGGEEERRTTAFCAGAGWWWGSDVAATGGVPKHRHLCRRYLRPERPLRARLELSCYFREAKTTQLCAQVTRRKLFINLIAGSIAGVAPSGWFPGGGAGSRLVRSSSCGGEDWGLIAFSFSLLGSSL